MLYMPSIFGEDLMDRWFDDMDREFARMEKPLYGHNAKNLMKTDVREEKAPELCRLAQADADAAAKLIS